jgi:hypothetical protein
MNIYKKELELWKNQQQIAKKKGVILKKAEPKLKKNIRTLIFIIYFLYTSLIRVHMMDNKLIIN